MPGSVSDFGWSVTGSIPRERSSGTLSFVFGKNSLCISSLSDAHDSEIPPRRMMDKAESTGKEDSLKSVSLRGSAKSTLLSSTAGSTNASKTLSEKRSNEFCGTASATPTFVSTSPETLGDPQSSPPKSRMSSTKRKINEKILNSSHSLSITASSSPDPFASAVAPSVASSGIDSTFRSVSESISRNSEKHQSFGLSISFAASGTGVMGTRKSSATRTNRRNNGGTGGQETSAESRSVFSNACYWSPCRNPQIAGGFHPNGWFLWTVVPAYVVYRVVRKVLDWVFTPEGPEEGSPEALAMRKREEKLQRKLKSGRVQLIR
ncbi:hypothetical protein TGRH88_058990 [Toxoplasma gondii]|uniref:Uncharacterized protein n=1 Tax=Toxoplasma gondii TaxID=5811 RepID=A0A7J6JVA5_TOXGO|nr:hypothetical protein TGRH88_058990 [Toxoplasma gondii]